MVRRVKKVTNIIPIDTNPTKGEFIIDNMGRNAISISATPAIDPNKAVGGKASFIHLAGNVSSNFISPESTIVATPTRQVNSPSPVDSQTGTMMPSV